MTPVFFLELEGFCVSYGAYMGKPENKEMGSRCGMICGIGVGIGIQIAIIFIMQLFSYYKQIPHWVIFIIQFIIILSLADLLSEDSRIYKIWSYIKRAGHSFKEHRCTKHFLKYIQQKIFRYSMAFSLGFSAFAVISLTAEDIAKEISDCLSIDSSFIKEYLSIFENASVKEIVIAFTGLAFSVLLAEFSNKINKLERSKEQQNSTQNKESQ